MLAGCACLVALPALGGAAPQAALGPGYRLLGGDGGVFSFSRPFSGSASTDPTSCPANPPARLMPNGSCWSMAATPDEDGYWILNAYDGRVLRLGDAGNFGQPADTPPYQDPAEFWPTALQVVPTPDGNGYWVLEVGGGGLGSVQAFGDAAFYGDEVSSREAHAGTPVGMAATADGKGYWIVESDGGVFSYGDAAFEGSMGGQRLAAPVVGMTIDRDGGGYWLAASDGGVFSFGTAAFGGSMGGQHLNAPVTAITTNVAGTGYWLAVVDGGVFALGGARFLGSMGGSRLNRPVMAMAG